MIVLEYILLVGVIVYCYCSAAVQAAAGIGNRVYGAVPDDGGAVEPAPEPGSGHYGGGCGRRCDQHPLFLTLKKIHALKGTRDE